MWSDVSVGTIDADEGHLILFVLLATLVSVPVASAGPALAVKSGGQWYWSLDIANGMLPPLPAGRRQGDATRPDRLEVSDRGPSPTADQKRWVQYPGRGS